MPMSPPNAALSVLNEVVVDAGPARSRTRRIAVADDDPEMRALIHEILRDPVTEVVEATNGAELIQLLAEQGPFDLIVTDVDMPWMEGLQVLRSARAADILTPAVVVTGLSRPDLDATVARLGVTKLLRKPFGAAELRKAIRSLLGAPP